MPAVVRGGRRRDAAPPPRGGARKAQPAQGRGGRNAPTATGKLAALRGMDLSPRAIGLWAMLGAVLLALVLFTGARAERIGAAVSGGVNRSLGHMGLALRRVHIQGASAEARPAIEAALDLHAGQPITGIDLDAIRDQAMSVGWVQEARVVRLLPDTLIVAVTEHQRLAVWQTGGLNYVIDGQGDVIPGADAGRYPELPLVVGAGAERAAPELLALLRQRPRLMSRIDAVVRVDERRWDLRLRDGGVVQLPASGQDAALIQLDALDQRERLLDLGFARVDLRTPEQLVVRPRSAA